MHITTMNVNDVLAKLHKQIIGSDNFFNFNNENVGFPPYNIEKLSEDNYKLTLAIAGFTKEDISVKVDNGSLFIKGSKVTDENRVFLHQGIAERDFSREFKLMDNTHVIGAEYKDGLLIVDIKRELPELLKPRTIDIV